MPTPLMKSFAQQSGKKSKTVEKLWKKCERIVKKEYDIDEKSSRFYPLVVGCLKNLLDIKKKEIAEDDIGVDNMGDYTYAQKMQPPFTRVITSDPSPVKNSKKKRKKLNYPKVFNSFAYVLNNNPDQNLDDIMSEMINFYCERLDDSEEIIEKSIEMSAKYLKLNIEDFEIE